MPLSRRLSTIFAILLGAAALVAAGVQSAVPQARPKGPPPLSVTGSQALLGDHITFTTPQFKVEALWFKANDETGWYWTGSDEVYAVFSDMDPTHMDRLTTEYENVDEGDTVNFGAGDTCMAPQSDCVAGMADLNVRFTFWESDYHLPLWMSYCPNDFEGSHFRLQFGCTDDDLIGRGSIIYSRDELVAMMPAVGDSREFTAVMDKDAGKYRFRYRITRLANTERSIVIHLPPLEPMTPAISLQATVSPQARVTLTWSGATATSVDIYRNGSLIITTPNSGTYEDGPSAGTYQYRVCDAGSTTSCSDVVSVTVP